MIEKFLQYISYQKRQSPHTISSYKNDLEQFHGFLSETFQVNNLCEVNYQMIRSWIISLSEQKLQPTSINRKIATLKSFYKFLVKNEYLQQNPTLRIKPLKTPKRKPSFIDEKELMYILDKCEFSQDFKGYRDKLVLELLYHTGIREAELLGLKEEHINFVRQEIKVHGKGGKDRIIPISPTLKHLLEEYIQYRKSTFPNLSHNYLITTNKGKPAYPMLIYRIVRKYLSLASSAERKSPHTLRHTFATHMLNKGANLNAIKELLGHSNLKATQIYTHNSLQKLKEVFKQAHPKG